MVTIFSLNCKNTEKTFVPFRKSLQKYSMHPQSYKKHEIKSCEILMLFKLSTIHYIYVAEAQLSGVFHAFSHIFTSLDNSKDSLL